MSLVYVVHESKTQIEELLKRLDHATGKQVEPILRALGKEADVCSAALSRLARHYVNALPDENSAYSCNEPKREPKLLEIARRLQQARVSGFCESCGGIASTSADDCEGSV